MNLPKKVVLSKVEIMRYEIKFPSGKKLVLGRDNPQYITDDMDELDFLSRQKGVAIIDLNDMEFKNWMTKQPKERPDVRNKNLTPDDIREFKWTTDLEEEAISHLKSKGYSVFLRSDRAKKVDIVKEPGDGK